MFGQHRVFAVEVEVGVEVSKFGQHQVFAVEVEIEVEVTKFGQHRIFAVEVEIEVEVLTTKLFLSFSWNLLVNDFITKETWVIRM